MLVFRMFRSALSRLLLVLSLGLIAIRLAPYYLSPETNAVFQDRLADLVVGVAGPYLGFEAAGSSDFGDHQQTLEQRLKEAQARLRAGHSFETAPEGAPLPAPDQPAFQPSARPAYGVTAPRTTGPKVIRVGE